MRRTVVMRGVVVVVALACVDHVGDRLWLDSDRWTVFAQSGCTAVRNGKPVTGNQDALARLLASSNPCPRNAIALRREITTRAGDACDRIHQQPQLPQPRPRELQPVRGRDGRPAVRGSRLSPRVSSLVISSGRIGPRLTLDQIPDVNALMIEVIVWDPAKSLFNFYELRGTGTTGRWDYKGDSADILTDTERLHRDRPEGVPPISDMLRCSSRHVNGGPIMKELATPHNDWWSAARRLPLGGRQLDDQLTAIAMGFVDGDRLAASVRAGLSKLATSAAFQGALKRRSLQEQLRPLFCPAELNLESDPTPLDDNVPMTRVPSALVVDPRLGQATLEVARADYDAALRSTGSRFPEINRPDGDRAWLGPVKAISDQMRVQSLVEAKLIDDEFVADVLAVDFTNPVLSKGRCNLLKHVPTEATPDWRDRFLLKLSTLTDAHAKDLATNLTSAERTAASHRQRAGQFLAACREKLKTRDFVVSVLRLVQQRRQEVGDNEISKGLGGKILEPGFRVIFPEPASKPGALTLSPSCGIG